MNSIEKLRKSIDEVAEEISDHLYVTIDRKTVALLLDVVEASSGWGNEVPEEITAALKAMDEHLGTSEITPQTDPKD